MLLSFGLEGLLRACDRQQLFTTQTLAGRRCHGSLSLPQALQFRYTRMTSTPQSTTSQSSQTPNDGAKKQSFVMTDEMAAKQQARREAKLAKKAANRAVNGDGETTSGATTPGGSQILRREWKRLPTKQRVTEGERSQSFRLLTWNMLAQTLVRELTAAA